MRDEVFRVGRGPLREGEHDLVRTVEIEGWPWWVVRDLVIARGFGVQSEFVASLLTRVPEGDSERVWLLPTETPGIHGRCPRIEWVVSADGASVVHDVLAARPRGLARRRARREARRAPGFLPPLSERYPTEEES